MAMTAPAVAASARRSGGLVPLAAVLLALLLPGCSAGAPAPAPSGGTAGPPPSATTASADPSGGTTGGHADGPSFGVDRVAWPRTLKEAEPLLLALPETFEGRTRSRVPPPGETGELAESGPSAGVQYGAERSLSITQAFTTTETEDGKPVTISADELLAASFLLDRMCAEGSYRGTARPAQDGAGPSMSGQPGKGPVWFSCAAQGAGGEEDAAAHVVGWTSGKTAWQVTAPDEESLRSLVTVIRTALG